MPAFAFAVAVYAAFAAGFAAVMAFFENVLLPRTIDRPAGAATGWAVAIDLGWVVLFGLQHSLMARASVKRRLAKLVPGHLERTGYVLASVALFVLLLAAWRPFGPALWDVASPAARGAVVALGLAGWGIVLASTFLIDHFEFFGLAQPWRNMKGREPGEAGFRTPWLYRLVRHPLYFGLLLAFWAAPTLTAGHALLAGALTLYIAIGMRFEERDLVARFGAEYEAYRRRVPALVPWPRGRAEAPPVQPPRSRT